MLVQSKNEEKGVIAYASGAFNATEQKYSKVEQVALAVIWGCTYIGKNLIFNRIKIIFVHRKSVSKIVTMGIKIASLGF